MNLSLDADAFNYSITRTSYMDENLIHIVLNFYKESDVMSAVEDKSWKFYGRLMCLPPTDNFGRLYDNVLEKVRDFILVDSVRERALHLVKPIGLLICEWVDFNKRVNRFYLTEFLDSIVFESPYSIDYSSSIDRWVRDCDDQARRLSLFSKTCYFCVENQVISIWNCMPRAIKLSFSYFEMNTAVGMFLHYWMHKLVNVLPIFMTKLKEYAESHREHWLVQCDDYQEGNLNWLMLRFSVLEGNLSAVKYFYRTLTNEQKAFHIGPCLKAAFLFEIDHYTRDPKFVHIIQFLYAEMNSDQQLIFLQMYQSFLVTLIAKYWQCQQRALQIIHTSWNCIYDEFYTFIIKIIARRIAEGRYMQENLLESIWEITPESMRKSFFAFVVSYDYSLEIFSEKVVTATEQILRDATTNERNKILSFYEL